MEIIIVIAVIGGLLIGIFKLAKSKNREPIGWLLVSLIISPLIILLILACMPKLPKQRGQVTTRKKRSIKKGR